MQTCYTNNMYSSDTVHRAVNILIKTLNILSRTNIYKHKFIKYKLETCDLFCGSSVLATTAAPSLVLVWQLRQTYLGVCVCICVCLCVCVRMKIYMYVYIYIYIYVCTRPERERERERDRERERERERREIEREIERERELERER